MTTRLPVWCFLLLAVCLAGLIAPQAAYAQDEQTIAAIEIVGNQNISQDAILASIDEKPGTPFTTQQMVADRANIEKMGFFQVVQARQESVPGGIKVVFEVVEYPKITSIVFEGNTQVTREELLEAMRLKEAQVFNINTWDQDLKAISDLYAGRGYLATVTAEANHDEETGVLTIPILEFRVGVIRFEGLRKTKSETLLREMELKPGDVYNANQLQKDITRIYETDFLDVNEAKPPRREPSDRPGYLDIIIPVAEKKTGQVSVGLGYSSLQKVVGRIEVSESNLQGRGLGANALYEVSGTGTGPSYELGFYNPWLRKDHTSLSVRVYDKEIYRFSSSVFGGGSTFTGEDDYRERRRGGSIGLSKPFGDEVRGFLTLRSESVDTTIPEDADLDPDFVYINQDGSIYSMALKGVLDSRDFRLDPAAGSLYSLTWEPGYADVSGSESNLFSKYELDLRKYFSAGGPKTDVKDKRRTIAVRMQLAWSNGFLPFWEQFFLGGAERLRGYREDRFWGNRLFLASAEYRVPLGGGLGGVVFADYGSAWGEDYLDVSENLTQTSSFEGHFGYGLGIRVSTPIGNLRFDYGFGDEGSRTHFSIGQAF